MSVKKTNIFFISFVLSMLMLSFVHAQESPYNSTSQEAVSQITGIDSKYIPQSQEDIDKQKDEYLKKEWATILKQNKYIGPVIEFLDMIFTFLNPFFKTVLGVEYSMSWAFVFALSIWIILFVFIYSPVKTTLGNAPVGFLATFAVVSLIGLSGVIRKAVDVLVDMITNTWIAWIAFAITVVFIVISKILGRMIAKKIAIEKEKSRRDAEGKDRSILHVGAQSTKKELESD